MFLDMKSHGPRPEPLPPKPTGPNLTPRDQKVIAWVICVNILILFIAPIGGATVIQSLLAMLFS